MKAYRYTKLSDKEKELLTDGYKNSPLSHFRIRCHALLLSNEGRKIEAIAQFFNKRLETIRSWMNDWEAEGLAGLLIKKGRGRKSTLQIDSKEAVELIKKKSMNSR